jgi:hypothetical protein
MKEARWGVMNHYLADWIARNEKMKMNDFADAGKTNPKQTQSNPISKSYPNE